MNHLSKEDFERVVRDTPLVSIDLIVRDKCECYLLGQRNNEPAKGKYFVIGGRIKKGENVDAAFHRIAKDKLNVKKTRRDAVFIGIYDHNYVPPQFEQEGFRTQYVVLGYELVLEEHCEPPRDQYHNYIWWSVAEILASPDVHENTKAYFRQPFMRSEAQYNVLATRRNTLNTMLWQTPALSLTAIAFLLNVAGNKSSYFEIRVTTCILAILVSLITLQLFCRHRKFEARDSERLEDFEIKNGHLGYARINARPERPQWMLNFMERAESILKYNKIAEWPSYLLWIILFIVFVFASFFLLVCNLQNSWGDKPEPSTNPVSSEGMLKNDVFEGQFFNKCVFQQSVSFAQPGIMASLTNSTNNITGTNIFNVTNLVWFTNFVTITNTKTEIITSPTSAVSAAATNSPTK